MSTLDVVRLGALGAMLGGALWMASGVVSAMNASGWGPEVLGSASLEKALCILALVGTLGGIGGLHARQAPGYGRLGMAGFLAAFACSALLVVGLLLSFLVRSGLGVTFLNWMLGLGLWGALVGFVLLGAATVRLRVLPKWCGAMLIFYLPLAIALGDYGGGTLLGLAWLAVSYVLLSQRDVSALIQTRRR